MQRVADLMGEIAAASNEQSQGIGQVNQSIAEMDDVTQQNAALVEEAAAAAGSLQEQSARLAEVVAVFKLEEDQHAAAGARLPLRSSRRRKRLYALLRQSLTAPAKSAPRKQLAPAQKGADDWEEF